MCSCDTYCFAEAVTHEFVVEREIERDAGAGIVVEIKVGEQTVGREVAGQAVELVVERSEVAHGQAPHSQGRDKAAGTVARTGDVLDDGIADALNRDAIVANGRAFAVKFPKLALLVKAIAVNEEVADVEILDGNLRMVDGFAKDDDGAIGVVREHHNGVGAGTAQGLGIAPQNDGLVDVIFARRKYDFATING